MRRNSHRQRDVSIEWTFGTAASAGLTTPRPYTPDMDDIDEDPYRHAGGTQTHTSSKYLTPGGASSSNVHRNSMNMGAYQDEYGPLTDDDEDYDDTDDEFDGGTFMRDDDEHRKKLKEAAKQMQSAEFNGGTMAKTNDVSDEFDIGFDYKKIRLSMKQNSIPMYNTKPRLRNDITSVVSYSIGVQTEESTLSPKIALSQSTQTQTDESVKDTEECKENESGVSELVGVYKDMDDLFNLLKGHIDENGQEHLASLRAKVKKLTHMKITQRKQNSNESAHSIKIARDRIQQIRQRRSQLNEKHKQMQTMNTVKEND